MVACIRKAYRKKLFPILCPSSKVFCITHCRFLMFKRYCLSVAGVHIQFESDCEILQNEEFLPFITKECTADIHATIRMARNIPKIPEKTLYADMFCAVAENEAGFLQKFFFGSADGHDQCVVSTYDPDNKHILIEYPDLDAYKQLTLSSCFYWLGFESCLLQRKRLCLHASFVDTHLGGILFSGVSGIGKSTQAELWCNYRRARQINGDRPILSKEENGWIAWGSPYAGSSRCYVNESSAVSAIVLLKQSPKCTLRRLKPSEAFRGVWAGLTIRSWDPAFVDSASLLAMDLVTAVPVYEFCCTPDEYAVNFLEAELRREGL